MEFLSFIIAIIFLRNYHCIKTFPKWTFCQERSVLLGSQANMAKVVDGQNSAFIKLECHFCKEKGDYAPKIWKFKKRGYSGKSMEVPVGLNTNATENRISITPIHTLVMANISFQDSGIYSCLPINEENESIFTYYLDGIINASTVPKSGKISQWKKYKRSKIDPFNDKFEKSNEPAFRYLRDNFNFSFRLVTVWEPWGPCEAYGRSKGHGIKRKQGKCRLHPLLSSRVLPPSADSFVLNMTAFYLKEDYDVSCHSETLHEHFPELSEQIRKIPEFTETARCQALSGSATQETLSTQKDEYKFRTTHIIPEKSHLTLYCPETTLDSNIVWYKDKKVLNSTFRNNMADGEEEPNLTIDSYNSLYILHATKSEQGKFSCTVDGEKMQIFTVEVVSKSKIQRQEFLTYSIYLAFVLTLSLTCYCLGVCVAWRRRSSFADPLNLRIKHEAIEVLKCESYGKCKQEENELLY